MTLELGGNAVPLGTEVFARLLCFHTAVFQRRTVFFVLLRKLSALCLKLLFEDRAGFFVELLLLLGDLLVCKERQFEMASLSLRRRADISLMTVSFSLSLRMVSTVTMVSVINSAMKIPTRIAPSVKGIQCTSDAIAV